VVRKLRSAKKSGGQSQGDILKQAQAMQQLFI